MQWCVCFYGLQQSNFIEKYKIRNLLSFFCRIITFQMLEEEKALSNTAAVVVSLLMIVSSKKKDRRRMYLTCAS